MAEIPNPDPLNDDTPPIFNTWSQVYWFVLAMHALLIFLFWLFTFLYS